MLHMYQAELQNKADLNESSHLINQDVNDNINDCIIDVYRLIEPIPNELIEKHVFDYLDNRDLAQFSGVSRLAYLMVSNTQYPELAKQFHELEPSCFSTNFVKSLSPAKMVGGIAAMTLAGGLGMGISYAFDYSAIGVGLINATNTSLLSNGISNSVYGFSSSLTSLLLYPAFSTLKMFGLGASQVVINFVLSEIRPIVQGTTTPYMVGVNIAKSATTIASSSVIGIITRKGLNNFSLFSDKVKTDYENKITQQKEILQKLLNSAQDAAADNSFSLNK